MKEQYSQTAQELVDEIHVHSTVRNTIISYQDELQNESNVPIINLIQTFTDNLGCNRIGEQWKEVSRLDADKIAFIMLTTDLAYIVEIMPAAVAIKLWKRFCSHFESQTRYFVNRTLAKPGEKARDRLSSEWSNITDATFDVGIVVYDGSLMGLLCVMDED